MNAYTASSVTKQKGTVMKGPHYTEFKMGLICLLIIYHFVFLLINQGF